MKALGWKKVRTNKVNMVDFELPVVEGSGKVKGIETVLNKDTIDLAWMSSRMMDA
jgi:hypothetical protein